MIKNILALYCFRNGSYEIIRAKNFTIFHGFPWKLNRKFLNVQILSNIYLCKILWYTHTISYNCNEFFSQCIKSRRFSLLWFYCSVFIFFDEQYFYRQINDSRDLRQFERVFTTIFCYHMRVRQEDVSWSTLVARQHKKKRKVCRG